MDIPITLTDSQVAAIGEALGPAVDVALMTQAAVDNWVRPFEPLLAELRQRELHKAYSKATDEQRAQIQLTLGIVEPICEADSILAAQRSAQAAANVTP